MEEIDEDTRFAHAYEYTLLRERPGGPTLTYFYPGARTDGGQDGILVRFAMSGAPPWIGVFALGTTPGGASGVYTHPDAYRICVVSYGNGYIVRVDDPTQWTEMESGPIFGALAIPDHGLLVVATYSELIAYGTDGPVWQTERLALDQLRITSAQGNCIYACANRIDGDDIAVTVDATTGKADFRHPW
jgi:hypothetical protein